jgi:hypothetical protein
MNGEVINPLRRRMVEDMTIRNLDGATQRGYLRAVRACCTYCGRGPGQLTFEDVRRFQLHLMESGLKPASVPRPDQSDANSGGSTLALQPDAQAPRPLLEGLLAAFADIADLRAHVAILKSA